MTWRNTTNGYGLIQILLHWMMAAVVAVLLPLGLWMTSLDYYHPWYKQGPDLHRAIGVLLGALLITRWLWRTAHTQPRPLTRPGWETSAATIGHRLLYVLPLLLVISGYLVSTADGRPVDVFGWFEVPATVHGVDGQEDIAGDVHFALAMLLLAVIALHVAAALRHHFVVRDDTLRRMLRPGDPRAD
jgi:cytochrome b561